MPDHAHKTRESRDACAAGNCEKSTIVVTWPDISDYDDIPAGNGYPVSKISIRTLNNIELVYLIQNSKTMQVNSTQLDDLITQLQYAKWYFEEGKYYEQTAP